MERIGLMGGTFDPIHNGHIAVACAAAERVGLDRVILIPAGTPPHKRPEQADKLHRLNMTRLAAEPYAKLCVSDYETRSGRVNYTVDTLRRFRTQYPDDELYFIIGADSFRDLPLWKDYRSLMRMTRLIVVSRPDVDRRTLLSRFSGEEEPPRLFFVDGVIQPESSSDVRERLRSGDDVSALLPPSVLRYIRENRLYES